MDQKISEEFKVPMMRSLYRLGDFEIDVLARQLRRNGQSVALSGKPFELLLALLERPGRVVTKDELMKAVWQNSFVEEANLSQCVFVLRKALGEQSSNALYIVTIPGRGYQLGIMPEVLQPFASSVETQKAGSADVVSAAVETAHRQRARSALLWSALSTVLLIAVWIGYRSVYGSQATPFTHMKMRRLTNSGDVQQAAISPSGRYLAYVTLSQQGQVALIVSDLKSGGTQVIFKSDTENLRDPVFQPDEAVVLFRSASRAEHPVIWTEMRIPLLGGAPSLVVRDIDGPLTFLRGGSQICFGRNDKHGGMTILAVNAVNGGEERILAKTDAPAVEQAVCSPDGKRVLLSTESDGLSVVDFKPGTRSALQSTRPGHEIFISGQWNWEGSGIFGASVKPFQENSNLFFLTYPRESRTRITHDLNSYGFPSLTRDQKEMVATQRDPGFEFHSYPLPLTSPSDETSAHRWSDFLGWSDDNTLIGSGLNGSLKTFDLTSEREEAVPMPAGIKLMQPARCGREGWIAMGSLGEETALSIWYMRRDGSDLRRLTQGLEDILPVCTQDGLWAVYADNSSIAEPAIYRVAVGGGVPQLIGDGTVWFALSPDGQKLAWFGPKDDTLTLFVRDLSSNSISTRVVTLPGKLVPSRSLTWSPDQRDIFFTVHDAKADAIWKVTAEGGTPVKIFELPGHFLAAISVSPTGKRLGVVTAHPISDAVLIENDE